MSCVCVYGLCLSAAHLLGFVDEILGFSGEKEERYGGCDGDDEDVVHPDVVCDWSEEYEEEDNGDRVEGGGQETSDYPL